MATVQKTIRIIQITETTILQTINRITGINKAANNHKENVPIAMGQEDVKLVVGHSKLNIGMIHIIGHQETNHVQD